MRRHLIATACLAALPCIAHAQAATTPAAATAPVRSDSAAAGPSSVIFRIGGISMSGERNYSFNKSAKTATGTVKGVEVLLRGPGVGISGRSLAGTFAGQPDVISADVNLLLGPPAFTLSVGGSRRALSSTLGSQFYTFGRVGLQMSFLVGGSGLRAQVGAWGYVPSPDDQKRMDIGGEGEGSIIYCPPKIPIYLQLGYRNEVFKSKAGTTITPEEVRGIRLGAGIQFGGK